MNERTYIYTDQRANVEKSLASTTLQRFINIAPYQIVMCCGSYFWTVASGELMFPSFVQNKSNNIQTVHCECSIPPLFQYEMSACLWNGLISIRQYKSGESKILLTFIHTLTRCLETCCWFFYLFVFDFIFTLFRSSRIAVCFPYDFFRSIFIFHLGCRSNTSAPRKFGHGSAFISAFQLKQSNNTENWLLCICCVFALHFSFVWKCL